MEPPDNPRKEKTIDVVKTFYDNVVKKAMLKKKQVPYALFKNTFYRAMKNVLYGRKISDVQDKKEIEEGMIRRKYRWVREHPQGLKIGVQHAYNIQVTKDPITLQRMLEIPFFILFTTIDTTGDIKIFRQVENERKRKEENN